MKSLRLMRMGLIGLAATLTIVAAGSTALFAYLHGPQVPLLLIPLGALFLCFLVGVRTYRKGLIAQLWFEHKDVSQPSVRTVKTRQLLTRIVIGVIQGLLLAIGLLLLDRGYVTYAVIVFLVSLLVGILRRVFFRLPPTTFEPPPGKASAVSTLRASWAGIRLVFLPCAMAACVVVGIYYGMQVHAAIYVWAAIIVAASGIPLILSHTESVAQEFRIPRR